MTVIIQKQTQKFEFETKNQPDYKQKNINISHKGLKVCLNLSKKHFSSKTGNTI